MSWRSTVTAELQLIHVGSGFNHPQRCPTLIHLTSNFYSLMLKISAGQTDLSGGQRSSSRYGNPRSQKLAALRQGIRDGALLNCCGWLDVRDFRVAQWTWRPMGSIAVLKILSVISSVPWLLLITWPILPHPQCRKLHVRIPILLKTSRTIR